MTKYKVYTHPLSLSLSLSLFLSHKLSHTHTHTCTHAFTHTFTQTHTHTNQDMYLHVTPGDIAGRLRNTLDRWGVSNT